MTYLCFVQGEGRGHLSQAITLKEKLEANGHRIAAFVVSSNDHTPPPDFFKEQVNAPIFLIANPGFVVDKRGQGINIPATVGLALRDWRRYRKSYQTIKKIINDYQPDALISCYELLVGVYHRLTKDRRPLYCLGHQYFVEHPDFRFPPGQILSRLAFQAYNYLTTSRRSIRIALSFAPAADQPDRRLWVCPPLIRRSIKEQVPTVGDFLLVYILNAGYSEKISAWSQNHPGVKVEAFWDRPQAAKINNDLHFHPLSGAQFIALLASCRAYASTGGFDSISEAAYLQKPILMNPTKNHFEQRCNAVDAWRAGLAETTDAFDLSLIAETKNHPSEAVRRFKEWVDDNDDKIIRILEKPIS
ncbi:MAG: glycosyltransferase family protein [Patescibacteria group bacterium]